MMKLCTDSSNTMVSTRKVAHIDMDAFFASCELAQYPELRGLPVVVAGHSEHRPRIGANGLREFSRLRDYVGRGVLTTATYEARALGVNSGMPTMKAGKLAPDAILLPVNFELYRRFSHLFKLAVIEICPAIEDVGIDELYADISALPDDALTVALRIKEAVRAATGLTCSIGITPNKLLSKISSDLQKPDGVTILGMEDVPTRIWPLPVNKINGIGPKATAKLATLKIKTIGELAQTDPALLQRHFGHQYALWLTQVAHGRDDRPVVTSSEPKSISRETTFEKDLHPKHDREALSEIFTELCYQVSADLQRKGYRGNTISIKIRFDNFQTVTRSLSILCATDDKMIIRKTAGQCLKRVPLDRRIRLLGVRASGLQPAAGPEIPLPQQASLGLG